MKGKLFMKNYSLTKNAVAAYSVCDVSLDVSYVPSIAKVLLTF